jgi:SAM-dependent methyltransferase
MSDSELDSVRRREVENANRMRHFVPNYLEPLLSKQWEIVSIGCGSGIDVEMLRRDGYQAYGFDPSRDNHFSLRDESARPFLRSGAAEEFPFGDKRFDFAYALEVIEHVGCANFGTHLLPDWRAERLLFLRSALASLRSPGRLLLSTSNRLCPIDPGHPHKYTGLGRLANKCGLPFGISVPWHKDNFLYSFDQLAIDVRSISSSAVIRTASIANYPTVTSRKGPIGRSARGFLSLIDSEPLRSSPISPLLVVIIDI